MDEKEFERILIEKGIPFSHIKFQKTIGDVKKLEEKYKKQIKKLTKWALKLRKEDLL